MKLTLDIFQEPETPGVWISRCVELDILSQHTKQDVALIAIAEAVMMTLQHEMKRRGLSFTEAFDAIVGDVAKRRSPIPTTEPQGMTFLEALKAGRPMRRRAYTESGWLHLGCELASTRRAWRWIDTGEIESLDEEDYFGNDWQVMP